MDFFEVLTLFFALALLALVPSTSVALIVVRSSTAGFSNGAAVAAGIVVGDLAFVYLAILGMTALAEIMGSFFLGLRYLAGLYLIWFGLRIVASKRTLHTDSTDFSAATLSTSFFSGLLITLGDIKAIFFYASLFPAFVDLTAIQPVDTLTIIALTIVAVGGVKLGYAYLASKTHFIKNRIAKESPVEKSISVAVGCGMVGTGTYLIASA
jgi:threonine/homoserine/homoserine lactone efflux protein